MTLPPVEFEDVVFDEATRRCGNESPIWRGFVDGAEWGAGWAFAIVGMAQAIRENHAAKDLLRAELKKALGLP